MTSKLETSSSIGLCLLTYNGINFLPDTVKLLKDSNWVSKCLIVDSNSTDGTVEYLKKNNFKLVQILNHEFNHGLTREMARKILNTDIVVFLTQDAFLRSIDDIYRLIQPICSSTCAVTYGRQIPHDNADFFESFPRWYNYPELDNPIQIRSMDDLHKYGMKLFFCSDSFSAYDNRILDKVGGFPETLTHEDYLVAYKLLKNGYKIGYISSAVVKHSHKYNLVNEFKRHFDAGYVRGMHKVLEATTGKTENEGLSYFKSFILSTMKHNFLLIPYAILIVFIKYLGFKIGYYSINFPNWLKSTLSGQSYYWKSDYSGNKINRISNS